MKFRLPSNEAGQRLTEYRRAYITGLDRTPGRLAVDVRNGLLTCMRDTPESGRLFVPWPIEGHGTPFVGTATLAERPAPYTLAVELARGKLNDLRNQASDWAQMGLRSTPELQKAIAEAQHLFVECVTSTDRLDVCTAAARACLVAAARASDLLVQAYTAQILQSRLASTSKLSTHLGCVLEGPPQKLPASLDWTSAFNTCHIGMSWKQLAPSEGQYRWDLLDAQLAWCRSKGLTFEVGPLIEFRQGTLPDWVWLWEADCDAISGLAADFVRQVVQRYRGRVPLWHVVHRPGSGDILGLTEEEQIRIAARAVQIAHQTDPSAQLTIGIDRPWAEWMGTSHFQLGPLHLCDYLLRADIGLSGVAIEIAPGFSAPGSHMRDLFELSRLLDLYSLLNVPLYVWMAIPSASGPDPNANPQVRVESSQWPVPLDEAVQHTWGAKWAALAVAKPFVRTLSWQHLSDGGPHLYPHAGLLRANESAKPLFAWMQMLRKETLV